ncbi:hypothetical protein AAA799E16_00402 [Marine Group I thaumarchaeote SCGC AAA799-E16]|uniref:Uncharacterized protein n=1 Tax=Marine Group I thaumarchaeote SCGC AAA799-E16 TaxID=1502292 RepID=A0A081S7I3_9ARCH|nr:hypothetical protein AAA799E16_00402 [Marine Group I thaumarchaeote SCGC AAA799-E16]
MKLIGIFLLFVLISGVMSFSSFDTFSDSSIPLKNIAAFAESGSSNDKDDDMVRETMIRTVRETMIRTVRETMIRTVRETIIP